MSIANDIMKEPAKSLETSMTKADFAERRASELAVKTELSDEEDTYYFDDGSLLIICTNGAMRSGVYKSASKSEQKFKVGQVWANRREEPIRVKEIREDGIIETDAGQRMCDGRVQHGFDLMNDLVRLISEASPPPLLLPDLNAKIEQSDAEGVYFANDGKERDWTQAEQLEEFRKLHAALSMRKAPPLPFPCLRILGDGGSFEVIGVHGNVVTSAYIKELETFKTGLGYPAYIKREIQFDAVSVTTYEEQP